MAARVHVIGAGLAGLAAAVELARRGRGVTLYEAGHQAGGRCRSYFDRELGCRIDNGNHLLLAGNDHAMRYLEAIGARHSLVGPARAEFAFLDLGTGERWTLSPDLVAWIFRANRRVPGTRALDYLAAFSTAWAGPEATVEKSLGRPELLFRRLWQPFAVAVLNTEAESASARLLWRVLRATFGRGGAACRALVPRIGLSESLVDPALAALANRGAEIRLGERLRRIEFDGDRLARLEFAGASAALSEGDRVILAVTAPVARDLVPGLTAPTAFRAIVNAHYRLAPPPGTPLILGLVGGLAEWLFAKREVVSVTISAAERHVDRPAEELAAAIWTDVARAYDLAAAPMPAWRIVKERRATFAATPDQLRLRPGAATRWRNLFLAGDWTDTGLPGTIESAVRSGHEAAARVLASFDKHA